MSILNVISLLGGLALFLYGIPLMSQKDETFERYYREYREKYSFDG